MNPLNRESQDNMFQLVEKINRIALQVEEIHRWLVGNGKVGIFERLRSLSLQVKILGIAAVALLLDAVLTGRLGDIIQSGLKLLH
jgi:hypothetical protein